MYVHLFEFTLLLTLFSVILGCNSIQHPFAAPPHSHCISKRRRSGSSRPFIPLVLLPFTPQSVSLLPLMNRGEEDPNLLRNKKKSSTSCDNLYLHIIQSNDFENVQLIMFTFSGQKIYARYIVLFTLHYSAMAPHFLPASSSSAAEFSFLCKRSSRPYSPTAAVAPFAVHNGYSI